MADITTYQVILGGAVAGIMNGLFNRLGNYIADKHIIIKSERLLNFLKKKGEKQLMLNGFTLLK